MRWRTGAGTLAAVGALLAPLTPGLSWAEDSVTFLAASTKERCYAPGSTAEGPECTLSASADLSSGRLATVLFATGRTTHAEASAALHGSVIESVDGRQTITVDVVVTAAAGISSLVLQLREPGAPGGQLVAWDRRSVLSNSIGSTIRLTATDYASVAGRQLYIEVRALSEYNTVRTEVSLPPEQPDTPCVGIPMPFLLVCAPDVWPHSPPSVSRDVPQSLPVSALDVTVL